MLRTPIPNRVDTPRLDDAILCAITPEYGLVSATPKDGIFRVLSSAPALDFGLRPGLIIVGPSRAGKDTIINKAISNFPELQRVRTATTRDRRPDEPVDAMVWMRKRTSYETKREFIKSLVAEYSLIEYSPHFDDVYGLPMSSVFEIEPNKIPVINTHPNAARQIRLKLSNYFSFTTFLICPENGAALEERMNGSNLSNKTPRLLGAAGLIMQSMNEADYVALNPSCAQPNEMADQVASNIFRLIQSDIMAYSQA